MPPRRLILRLEGTGPLRVPASRLAEIIAATQDAVFDLGDVLGGYPYRARGAHPGDVKAQCELVVTDLRTGSLEATLQLPEPQTRLDNDLGDRALETFERILEGLSSPGSMDFLEDVIPDDRLRLRFVRSVVKALPSPNDRFQVAIGRDAGSLRRLTSAHRERVRGEYLVTPSVETDAEVEGCIVEIRILDPRHFKVFDVQREQIKCYFPKELDEAATGLLGQPVTVRGVGRIDASGEIAQIDIVHAIEPLESLRLDTVRWGSETFRLHHPLRLRPLFDDGTWVLENKELGIVAAASSLEECLRDFQEEFAFLWREYAQAPDADLTEDARALKRSLQEIVAA